MALSVVELEAAVVGVEVSDNSVGVSESALSEAELQLIANQVRDETRNWHSSRWGNRLGDATLYPPFPMSDTYRGVELPEVTDKLFVVSVSQNTNTDAGIRLYVFGTDQTLIPVGGVHINWSDVPGSSDVTIGYYPAGTEDSMYSQPPPFEFGVNSQGGLQRPQAIHMVWDGSATMVARTFEPTPGEERILAGMAKMATVLLAGCTDGTRVQADQRVRQPNWLGAQMGHFSRDGQPQRRAYHQAS